MGNASAKEKRRIIEEQQRQAKVVTVDERIIDDPNFVLLQEFPLYIEFFCPSAVDQQDVRDSLRRHITDSKTASTLSFEGVKIAAEDLSTLLPLYVRSARLVSTINLSGIEGLDLNLVTSALRYASPQLQTLDLQKTNMTQSTARCLVRGLHQFAESAHRTPASPTLTVLVAEGNNFYCTQVANSKINEQLATDADELLREFAINIVRPPMPETPFEVNGMWFRISEVDEYRSVASTFITVSQYNLGLVEDGEAKADFLERTVSAIIRAQRDPKRPEGLRYIPRLFHLQKYTKDFLSLVSENVARQQNFVQIGSLFSEATASQWTLIWRMEIVHQVSHVCSFFHTLDAGLREIFPLEILVDMDQKRVMYTQLGSLRPERVATRLHREVAGERLRFADPSENARGSGFSLAKDLYSLAKLLLYFLVPIDNVKVFNTMFQPTLNLQQDLSIPTQSYLTTLDSKLGDSDLSHDCKFHIAGLIAECTMKDEMRRPTAAAFASRLGTIIEEAKK